MYQYVIKFAKEGAICYTSHLDLLRLFKRVFKKSGINLAYSQGFNPHPKMGFAQPLSLGYSSVSEYLEFETTDEYEAQVLKAEIQRRMPAGITIFDCIKTENKKKSLAARAESAEYMIAIPLETALDEDVDKLCQQFLAQREILVEKRQKKSKKMKEVNIRGQIQFLNFIVSGTHLMITGILDSGSASNLSPELLITAIKQFFHLTAERAEINVMRMKINFCD